MQLTGKQIIERNIINKYIPEAIQQQGVDVRIKSIRLVKHSDTPAYAGFIPKEGKTVLPQYAEKEAIDGSFYLSPGWYDVELEESCDVPNNVTLHYKTRSSLVRCGAVVHSGQFDAGFKTDNMGCFLHVVNKITIEKGARIAQVVCFESDDVMSEDLYNGQWQEDNQRVNK